MLDIMEKTDVMLFNTFMEKFKTKDGITIDKNRVKTGRVKELFRLVISIMQLTIL